RVYLHLLARPYESVTVRGVRVRRVRAVTHVASGAALAWQPRLAAADELGLTDDPIGEVVIDVPPDCVDEHATVIALDL
ncbi:MAG TPA: hypothetical protein VFL94_08575, partial [Actinomycetales bacterium]|nr:hypothetical protein [Actinomycetales bacterium]